VDVLLKHGADVTAVDGFGHDSYHYSRLSKNQELVSLVKSYLDSATKGFVMLFMNCFYEIALPYTSSSVEQCLKS